MRVSWHSESKDRIGEIFKRNQILGILIFFSILICIGCGPPAMRNAPKPNAAIRDTSKATVWFVRSSRVLGETGGVSTVWDSENPLALLTGKQAFRVELDPGRHFFISTSGNTDIVEADLLPGKEYFVYLWYTDFMFSQTVHINPLYEGCEKWENKDEWFDEAIYMELIPENTKNWAPQYLSRVKKAMEEYDPQSDNRKRAILPEYGF
ncbi:MAG: hypothetical protein QNJ97_16650 [Myxococcota bacterium]|nr:hypothetical protein [Myxococcota bacterium]